MISDIERVFRPLRFGVDRGQFRLVMVFSCYIDDSDNSFGPVMGVGGYLAIDQSWIDFERHVDPYLRQYGVVTLRGKDFHNGHNDFKGWSGEKKAQFVDGLFEIASNFVISGVNSIVDKKHFQKSKINDRSLKNLSPLGLAFGSAVASILMKDFISHISGNAPVSFIVELGNKNNGNLVRYYKWLNEIWPHDFIKLGEISFVSKHDCRAIQLADFLAFHGRREGDRWAKSNYSDFEMQGTALKIMRKHIYHRHNRYYNDGIGKRTVDFFDADNSSNGIFLPENGIK